MKGRMRKIAAKSVILLCAALVFLGNAVLAKEVFDPRGVCIEAVSLGEVPQSADPEVNLLSVDGLEDYIVEQCLLHNPTIVIQQFSIPKEPNDVLMQLWYEIAMKHPEILIRTAYSFSSYTNSPYVYSITPSYITSSTSEDEQVRAVINNGIDDYISRAAHCDDVVGKLLLIHDEIIKDCEYDTQAKNSETGEIANWDSYHAYGLFKNHRMVCQGYSQLFYAICKKLGVEVNFCESKVVDHIWNYVKINGNWYHVDITWDDPVLTNSEGAPVTRTTAAHNHFLVSDATAEARHYDKSTWNTYLDSQPDCNDTFFESNHIFNVPFGVTVTYADGKYQAPYDTLCFTSKDLYTGEIVTTEPTCTSNVIQQFYYCFDDLTEDLNFIIAISSPDGRLLNLMQNNRGPKNTNTIYQEQIYKPANLPQDAVISLMYWKNGTLIPLTAKKTVSEN